MAQPKFLQALEWPTVLLIVLVYVVLGALIWFHAVLPWWLILAVGAYAATLHTSLQHEVLHGHPTKLKFLNEALVFLTPTMWLPFHRYKETHLTHHNNAHLTDPTIDPESYYLLPEYWEQASRVKRGLYRINQTLAGRMVIGPLVGVVQFWSAELRDVLRGDRQKAKSWAIFAASCSCVLGYVIWCGMPVWQYVLLIAYPGVSLALVRSFCEHQAAENIEHRTIIVECSWFWSLLYLNNNLHVPHHEKPKLAWYKLPAYYKTNRENLLAQNNGYLMSYAEIFRRYFISAKEQVAYPDMKWLRR
jgi:fatty acid desaturase